MPLERREAAKYMFEKHDGLSVSRILRNEVLDLYLFRNLAEIQEIVSQWRRQYNEDRPHDALVGLPPLVYAQCNLENSTSGLSA